MPIYRAPPGVPTWLLLITCFGLPVLLGLLYLLSFVPPSADPWTYWYLRAKGV